MTTIDGFDFEPEDSYTASDPIPERLRIIGRIVVNINEHPDGRTTMRRLGVVELLERLADDVLAGAD